MVEQISKKTGDEPAPGLKKIAEYSVQFSKGLCTALAVIGFLFMLLATTMSGGGAPSNEPFNTIALVTPLLFLIAPYLANRAYRRGSFAVSLMLSIASIVVVALALFYIFPLVSGVSLTK